MRNMISVSSGVCLLLLSVTGHAEPLTLKNDSGMKAENLKMSKIAKSSRSRGKVPQSTGAREQTIPLLSQVQNIFGKKNVAVVGFSSEENKDLVRDYVKKKGSSMNYSVRLDSKRQTADPFASIWNVGTIPHVYVISHKGNILWQGFPGDVRTFETAIREAIRYRDGA